MKIQLKWVGLLCILVAACNPRTQDETGSVTTVDSAPAPTGNSTKALPQLRVETFVPPAAIEGCTGLYAGDSASLKQQQYLFAASHSGTAFINLNGQLQQLTLQQRSNNSAEIKETYTANNLKVTVTVTQQQQSGDEVWLYHGTILIESEGEKLTVAVWGEVGC